MTQQNKDLTGDREPVQGSFFTTPFLLIFSIISCGAVGLAIYFVFLAP